MDEKKVMGPAGGMLSRAGRKPGIPNKATTEFRQAITRVLEDNSENFGRWLTLVAEGDGTDSGKPDPARALDLVAKLAEFAAPKLARTEVVGDEENPLHTRNVNRIELVALSGSSTDSASS